MLAFAVAGELLEPQALQGIEIALVLGGVDTGHHLEEGIDDSSRVFVSILAIGV